MPSGTGKPLPAGPPSPQCPALPGVELTGAEGPARVPFPLESPSGGPGAGSAGRWAQKDPLLRRVSPPCRGPANGHSSISSFGPGRPTPSFEGCHGDVVTVLSRVSPGKPHARGGGGPAVGSEVWADTVSWVRVKAGGCCFPLLHPGKRSHADVDDAPRDIRGGQQVPNLPTHSTPRVHTRADTTVSHGVARRRGKRVLLQGSTQGADRGVGGTEQTWRDRRDAGCLRSEV